ncbi:MAG: site-2 protease family protein [Gammaproteobacteria bacterium]|nr:site-2 protease family protein [Gammaproteobacteria bacterium]NND53840.1 site-2 protease family protein [Gammaproteobacteria bacterium]
MTGLDLNELLRGVAVGAIPILLAITLHEVAHGWAARQRGDRTAEMLGRLSLNPLRHIDPVGTVLVPAILWFTGGLLFGWAKPVPVAFQNLRNPKRDMVFVALAGPGANFVMALGWALVYKLTLVFGLANSVAGEFLMGMARIGLLINVLLAAFNLLPIPPLDGGRVLRGLVSEGLGKYLDRIEPFGLIIIVLLLFSGLLWAVVTPLYALVEGLVIFLVGL